MDLIEMSVVMQPNILHRVLSSFYLFNKWNENNLPRSPDATPAFAPTPPSNTRQDTAPKSNKETLAEEFQQTLQLYIDNGVFTFRAVMQGLIAQQKQQVDHRKEQEDALYAQVESEVERIASALPISQQKRYLTLVDRETLVNNKKASDWLHNRNNPVYDNTDALTEVIAELMQGAALQNPTLPFPRMPSNIRPHMWSLAVAFAAEHPDNLQQLLEYEISSRKEKRARILDNGWIDEDKNFFRGLSEKKQYTNDQLSIAVYYALSNSNLSLAQMQEMGPYIEQLNPPELERLKGQQVYRFIKEHLSGSFAAIPNNKLEALESFLNKTSPNNLLVNAKPISQTSSLMERVSNMLLARQYKIDDIVPMLEGYQGYRALDGGMKANEFVADVRAYLQDRVAAHESAVHIPNISAT